MCYFPIRIKNKRFVPTKKNGYEPPVCTDERLRYIEVECGYCFECRKKKKRMESEKLRATKRNTYSDILHGDTTFLIPEKRPIRTSTIQERNT